MGIVKECGGRFDTLPPDCHIVFSVPNSFTTSERGSFANPNKNREITMTKTLTAFMANAMVTPFHTQRSNSGPALPLLIFKEHLIE